MLQHIRRIFGALNPFRWLGRLALALANWRRGRFKKLDYILLVLPDAMPALPEPRGWLRRRVLGKPALSLWEIDRILERIGDDPRPKGVVLHLRGLNMSAAHIQTLRRSIERLREQGKRVICYGHEYDNATYYVASAADTILIQPGGDLAAIGLLQQATFIKNALETIGISLDVVAISPYKSAFDQIARDDFSPESRQQVEWLLDSHYDMLVNGIAEGRGMSSDAVRSLIDQAPYVDTEALEAGYIDAIVNEEGLAAHLEIKADHLIPWERADKVLLKKRRRPSDKFVAVLSLKGTIVNGESGRPPAQPPIPLPFIGEERIGDLTVIQQARNLMQDKNVAAVVLHVDSGGGSAAASEAMASALQQLAQDRPLVVYMDRVAGSGGYYISTPAQWIVAQPGTITGSIGVIAAKPITGGLWDRLHTRRIELTRGANATFISDAMPFTDGQRAQMRKQIEHTYRQFVARVAHSRKLTPEQVETIGGGRVWTGAQARDNGLVDQLGDFHDALTKARQLANLPDDAPVMLVKEKGKPLAPQLAEAANPAALLRYLREGQAMLFDGSAQFLMPLVIDPLKF